MTWDREALQSIAVFVASLAAFANMLHCVVLGKRIDQLREDVGNMELLRHMR